MGQDSLKAVCAAPGPFVTVFIPARHPGAADLPRAEHLKTIVRQAKHELDVRRFQGPIDRLVEPLEKFACEPAMRTGGGDSIIFRSPDIFLHLRLLVPTSLRLIVATHPHITPTLTHLVAERVYVLAITRKQLRLGRWHEGQCAEVPLPPGVPESFEETQLLDQPDHDLQSHASSGMSGVRFGTGTERDSAHDRLHQYLQVVDRGLTGLLKSASLVVVGVATEMSAFKAVSEHPNVLTAKPTSPAHLSWPELGLLATEALMEARRHEAEKVLAAFQESRRDRVTSGVREVLEAAREGRIHRLLIESGAGHVGLLGPSFPTDSTRIEGEQDLINAAAVETIRGRGEVYAVDTGELGESGPIAAILRYSA